MQDERETATYVHLDLGTRSTANTYERRRIFWTRAENAPQLIQNNFIVQGIDWSNPNANVSPNFTVREVFTNGGGNRDPNNPDYTFQRNRMEALFALPTNTRDEIISNILRIANELERLRTIYGPLIIESWYRDPVTNARISAAGEESESRHMRGYAVDVRPSRFDGLSMQNQLDISWSGGLGYGYPRRNFIHLDLDKSPGNTTPYRRWNY
jgi:uncharacterized protein YcbK (DUF882 family)